MSLSSDTYIVRWTARLIIVVVGTLLLLVGCASDEADDSQSATQQSTRTSCLTAVNDKDWTNVPSYSADDIAWFNVPGNFAQYASTCQTAAITALVIGNQYGHGDGVAKDPVENIDWWKRSAALGDIEAEVQLGYLYSVKYGIVSDGVDGTLPMKMRDDKKAFQWWSRAAAHGNAQAANMVASMYIEGVGVAKDYSHAVFTLFKLVKTGDHTAAFQLGECYKHGWGVPRDISKARYWLQQAQGNGSCDECLDTRSEIASLDSSPSESQDAPSGNATTANTGGALGSSQSAAEWQQDHQAKIDELTQEISDHEQQAQQDDANADEAEAQVQQNASANTSGPGGALLALGNAVEGGMNAGLAESERQDAANERRQAQEEREQLAELGAEQPPVAQNNSETIALTRMQTQAIRSGNTIEGQMNRERGNIQAAGQAAAERGERQSGAQEQAATAETSGSGFDTANTSSSDTSTFTYAQPATNCLSYVTDQNTNGILVTNNCNDQVVLTWARPSGTAVGLDHAIQGGPDIVPAGGTDPIPPHPVRVFACHSPGTPTKPGRENASSGWQLEYTDTSFICPALNQAVKTQQ